MYVRMCVQHRIHGESTANPRLATEGASFCESREATCWLAQHHVAVPRQEAARSPQSAADSIWIAKKIETHGDMLEISGYGLSKSTMCWKYECHEWHPPLPPHLCSWNILKPKRKTSFLPTTEDPTFNSWDILRYLLSIRFTGDLRQVSHRARQSGRGWRQS